MYNVLTSHAGFDSDFSLCLLYFFSVTINNADNSTDQFCMNLGGRMAMAFLKCWER